MGSVDSQSLFEEGGVSRSALRPKTRTPSSPKSQIQLVHPDCTSHHYVGSLFTDLYPGGGLLLRGYVHLDLSRRCGGTHDGRRHLGAVAVPAQVTEHDRFQSVFDETGDKFGRLGGGEMTIHSETI